MASVVEQRPNANLLHPAGFDLSVLVFDLKTESEWGEPGPPTADQDHQDQLGPCMCTPRRHRCKFFRDDPILRTSDTCFSLTEIRPVPWPDPFVVEHHGSADACRGLANHTRTDKFDLPQLMHVKF